MLRWCAWCQKFLGEVPPLNVYHVSHGVCPDCAIKAGDMDENDKLIDKNKGIKLFFKDIFQAVLRREFIKARELTARAADLGIDDTSLVFGVLQPTLQNIGLMWETGLIDVGQEHAYTDIVGQTLELLSAKSPHAEDYRQSARPDIILACVNGNYHSVGIRMLEYYLAINKVPSYVIAPGVPAAELAATAAKLKPGFIGFSIAISFQSMELTNIKKALDAYPAPAPKVYVGGGPIKAGYLPPPELGFLPLTGFEELLKAIKGGTDGQEYAGPRP
ncbi:MAG TPA: hypothetical protein DDW67_01240 [Elusimicrobia bacterium]|nr:hypothetical protein [Elusimicrobiota bacterium]